MVLVDESSGISRVPPLGRLVTVALLLGFLSLASRQLNLGSWNAGGVTILWPSNGFLLGVLLGCPKRHWPAYIGTGLLIDFGINLSLGSPLLISGYLSGCNMLEAVLAAVLLYPIIAPKPDLTQRGQLLAFLSYGLILAPAVAALAASFAQEGRFALSISLHNFHRWFTADSLGIATVTPLCLAFRARDRFEGRSWIEILGSFILLGSVTFGVFWQSRFPLLFMVLPVLLLFGVRLGLYGSALGLLMVSIVGGFLSTAGHGPIFLMTSASLSERDLVFQIFIACTMLLLYIAEVLISESKQFQSELLSSERRFRLLAEASSDIILLADLECRRQYVSPAAREVLGWKPERLLGFGFRDLVHPDDLPKLDRLYEECLAGAPARALAFRFRKADGAYLWLETNPRLYHDSNNGEPAGFVAVARDISRRKAEEEEQRRMLATVKHQAISDALTGIANRRHFDAALEREWLRSARQQTSLSLLLIDVDRFKPYNDVYGHVSGDECLRRIVAAIQDVINRPADLLARYGGEEFVAILPGTDATGARQVAEWVRQSVEANRLPHAGNPPHQIVTLSIGCATFIPRPELSHLQLLEAADQALYRAKSSGRNCTQTAEPFPEPGSVLVRG